jgi:hypothetical protein
MCLSTFQSANGHSSALGKPLEPVVRSSFVSIEQGSVFKMLYLMPFLALIEALGEQSYRFVLPALIP